MSFNIEQMQRDQMSFRRLTAEEALFYLNQVKFKFVNQPQVYDDFLDIMEEYKSRRFDMPEMMQRVSILFRGHPELIIGFNVFLPPGYRMEVQSNEQNEVSISGSNVGGTDTTSLTIVHPPDLRTTTTLPLQTVVHQSTHAANHNTPIQHSTSSVEEHYLNSQASEIFHKDLVQKVMQKVLGETGKCPNTLDEFYEEILKYKNIKPKPSDGASNDKVIDELLCKICCVKQMNMVFEPCGHIVTCRECAESFTECPICRTKINKKTRVYMS